MFWCYRRFKSCFFSDFFFRSYFYSHFDRSVFQQKNVISPGGGRELWNLNYSTPFSSLNIKNWWLWPYSQGSLYSKEELLNTIQSVILKQEWTETITEAMWSLPIKRELNRLSNYKDLKLQTLTTLYKMIY